MVACSAGRDPRYRVIRYRVAPYRVAGLNPQATFDLPLQRKPAPSSIG